MIDVCHLPGGYPSVTVMTLLRRISPDRYGRVKHSTVTRRQRALATGRRMRGHTTKISQPGKEHQRGEIGDGIMQQSQF